MKLIESIRNIFRIQELRQRILYTLLLLAVYRLGSYIILPGIDSRELQALFQSQQADGLLGFFNTFVGGAFGRGALFALGIMPYITASIIMQLAGAAFPTIQRWQREGESGFRKINQWTRFLTVIITLFQGIAFVTNLRYQYGSAIILEPAWLFNMLSVTVLVAATMFLVWLGERITDNGVGNGVSLIITIGIIAQLPIALINEARTNAPMVFFFEMISLGVITMAVILLTQGVRKVPVNYARRMMGNRMMGGHTTTMREYIPLKLNSSGVMPIIFAQALMFVPSIIVQAAPENESIQAFGTAMADFTGLTYNIVFFFLIILFTYFYTAIAVNPQQIADQLKRNGGFVPGVKPGKKTSEYIDTVLTRITLPGSIFLGFVAILPAIITQFGVSYQFAIFFGGTSLLIMIGVVLDTLQQIESYLLMRHYDGLTKGSGKKNRKRQTVGATI